jgi:hypothetical protein
MSNLAERAFKDGEGVFRMAPSWVPRTFCIPGKRLRLDPADLYAFGANRGGIDERWFASSVAADNGPLTLPDEGMSYVVVDDGANTEKVLFRDVIAELGSQVIGAHIWETYHMWPIFAKFFDNKGALPHHLHHRKEHAEQVGLREKPEAYYFPTQMNNYGGDFPYTFFGLEPGTTQEDVKQCLRDWNKGDNGILNLSKAYKLQLGTGWNIPGGILHAPGSLCTYEPQWASDIAAMFQSLVNEMPLAWDMLVKHVPADKKHDLDYIISLIDWDANVDPNFKRNHMLLPKPIKPLEEMQSTGCVDHWVVYGSPLFASKETVILPGRTVTMQDPGPYSAILVQGSGTFAGRKAESPTRIRFGQLTDDEFFVSDAAARQGITVTNPSPTDAIVILKTFGPGTPTN